MATVVIMPRQGQSVESCIITAFNKKVGDSVEKGENLFEVDTVRNITDDFKNENDLSVTVIAVPGEGKVNFVASAGKEAVKRGAHAGNLLKQLSAICGGGGGGRARLPGHRPGGEPAGLHRRFRQGGSAPDHEVERQDHR